MKTIQIEVIPYFDDNYSYLIHCEKTGKNALVDCGDSSRVLDYLEKEQLKLDYVLATHAHYDHAGDIPELIKYFPNMTVVKPVGESRLTMHGMEVGDGDTIDFGEDRIEVISVAAHTKHCTSFSIQGCLFVGDALFSGGCGRLFEGQPSDLEKVMDRLSAYPDDTDVYVGHEYTVSNLKFACSIEPDNMEMKAYLQESIDKVSKGQYTTPTTIGLEKKINPFFRIDEESVIASIDPDRSLSRTKRMGVLRSKKDNF